MPAADDPRLEIDYPTRWGYRIVGTCADTIRALAVELADGAEHLLEPSRTSSSGRYVSFRFELVVRDEAHRHAVLARLQAEATIRYVL